MKAEDMMKWVGLMNNFKNMAHEILLELIVIQSEDIKKSHCFQKSNI